MTERTLTNYSDTIQELFKHIKESASPVNQLNIAYNNSDMKHSELQSELISIDSQQFIIDLGDYLNDEADFPIKHYRLSFPGFKSQYVALSVGGNLCEDDPNNKYLQRVFTEEEINKINPDYMQFAVVLD